MTALIQLYVKSHVARDLLQSAALFKTDKLVVWEYVSNGLQYVNPGTNPMVKVTLDSKNKKIKIQDNGKGMDWSGLANYFVMHGENIDRKEGRPGRGLFGTGKSAAFGIAETLRITTVRNNKRSIVQLKQSDIRKMSSEAPINVTAIEQEKPYQSANGTLIEIEGVHLRILDQAGIIHYIERHLARWPKNASVFVNNHECEFHEPPVAKEYRFKSDGAIRKLIGDVELVVKVSKVALEEELRGVSIFSSGVWHEITLAGCEGKEMSQYIFGEIDVSSLDQDKSPIAPFDVSRSMRLNIENEMVRTIHSFIGTNVEEVRRALVEAEKKRKGEEDAKKLANQASEIARVINEDFEAFRQRVARVRAKTHGATDLNEANSSAGQLENDILFGNQLPAIETGITGSPGKTGEPTSNNRENIDSNQFLNPDVEATNSNAEKKGQPAGGTGRRQKPTGGFQIEFKNLGEDSPRAQYYSESRTIFINLDHPQLVAALGVSTIEDTSFRRLTYEVAFTEYAISLAQEFANRDGYMDPQEPLFDIRETLNRIARKGAHLYTQ